MQNRRTQLHHIWRTRPLPRRSLRIAALVLAFAFWWGLFGCVTMASVLQEPPQHAVTEGVIVINEVVTSNKYSYPSETLGSPDWIELHNLSDREIDLKDYFLTDKANELVQGHRLPNLPIPARGYVVLYADADSRGNDMVLPFGLSKKGETLLLLDPTGNILDLVTIPALPQDVSYARRADGTFGYCQAPTPGAENDGEITDVCPESGERSAARPEEDRPKASGVSLRFSEVASNDLKDGAFGGDDWIELYNDGAADVSLHGFFLSDRADKADKAALPALTVPAGGYAAVPLGQGEGRVNLGISSDGETLYLFDGEKVLVDTLTVPALLSGQSWARSRDGAFGYCGRPTPGAANEDRQIGSEPLRLADESEPLRLNEALFRNTWSIIDSYGDHADFVELYNAGTEPVALEEYYLSDDFDRPMKWRCPDAVVQPGAYYLIFLTGRESTAFEVHAPFSVSDGDDGLQLFHRSNRTVQRLPWSDQVPKNTAMGLKPDGTILYYKYPTPGTANAAAVDDVSLLAVFPLTDVHISEVCASGEDWVELRNGSAEGCSLDSWYLTDSQMGEKREALFGTLAAGDYALVTPRAFGIAATGETLFLYDGEGHLRDVFETGDLSEGITSGRSLDGTAERVFFLAPTPQEANGTEYAIGRTPMPIASDLSLYHAGPFTAVLRCADPSAVIRYTLDGSEPTAASTVYSEPIPVTGNVTIRAMAQAEGYLMSRTFTVTYLLREPHTLPVVTIACDPSQFKVFTQLKSIGRYPHTDAQITFYEADGTLGTAFPADINPRGNQSIKYPQKSFSIHLRNRLGQGSVNYPFWGLGTAADYGTLILRNGSQDYMKARLRDSFALRAVENLNLDSARTRPVIVYVNGTYYGIMDFNEGMNQDYLVTHFQVAPAKISHISTNSTVRYGKNDDFLRVRKFARENRFSDDAVLETFSQWVDVDYITDYLIAQTLFCNYDIKNQSYWATDDYAIRWRPVFYDIDRCFTDNSSRSNLFDGYFSKKGVVYDQAAGRVANMDLYAHLRDNAAWCDRFVHRYAELLTTEFSVERLQSLLDEMAATLRPEMAQHIALYGKPASMEEWEGYIASMRAEIALRHAAIQKQIRSQFHLSEVQWEEILREASRKDAGDP